MTASHPDKPGVAVLAATAAVLAAIPQAPELLTEAERERAAGLRRPCDRDDFVAAHVLVRLCGAAVFDVALDTPVVQRCDTCGHPHGRPEMPSVPQARLSLSHGAGVVAAAAARAAVGIDVEPLASMSSMAEVAATLTTPAERRAVAASAAPDQAMLMLWVRKEALVKIGRAALDGIDRLELADLPLTPIGEGHRRMTYGELAMVDLALRAPPAMGAIVSVHHLRIAQLEELLPWDRSLKTQDKHQSPSDQGSPTS